MTITNDERRRFAAKLRDFESLYNNMFEESPIHGMLGAKGYVLMDDWQKLCERIADYVEPEPERTCRIDTSRYENGGTVSCGACGKRIPTKSRSTKTVEAKYPYCPWCGARVEQ